ncbi:hydantoinase B/oxoprolinase family protein [Gracilibacillus salitolerans]|uniref:Hydantoinase B/oxoprolinase family protein n=1 Tax=Gracilibacillus salitolerans TaxID=2663022 RepID=A0A5Q2TMI4_9BACI|nr:hydantoinase B/oxoprolinase family protein [Gracilibacillus salitolerans]QGH36159.1 hydantoinase B/oxoprolinase family protein [Gracilibacillus salitolerans]
MRTDPANLEIMRSYFHAIASSMGHVIERTSYTTFVKESADFATALASPEGDFYVYPRSVGVTIFLGLSLKKTLESCGPLEKGDIVITNDPYTTNGLASHLPDVHIIKPIFAGDTLISYAWSFVHCSDVGGLVPASISPTASDIHQEGLRIPPVKIYRKGTLNTDIKLMLDANSRVPHLNYGDINAMVAAVNTAENRLMNMVDKFGVQNMEFAIQDLLDQSETRTRKVIEQIPDGTYSFHDYLDDDMLTEHPIRLAVDLTIDGNSIDIDLSRCDPQVKSAFNLVTNGSRHSFLLQGLINFIISEDPHIPVNGGILNPVTIHIPKGTIVNPEYPASVGVRHSITMRMYSTVLGALAKAIPDKIPAAGAGQAAIVVLSTQEEASGARNVAVVEPLGGGGGGHHDFDGIDGIDHSSGFLKNTPIESLEQHIDTLVHRYELIPNTAGSGQSRGGHAIQLDFEIRRPDSIVTARGMERLKFQPWGLFGGEAGSLGGVVLNPDTPNEKQLAKINVLTPKVGDVVSIRTASGGGWGLPQKRDPELVLREVEMGLISVEKAQRNYGVILETDGSSNTLIINQEKTAQLRDQFLQKRTNEIDLGSNREQFEQHWPEVVMDQLIEKLHTLPPNERWHQKVAIQNYLKDKLQDQPVTLKDLEEAWNHI